MLIYVGPFDYFTTTLLFWAILAGYWKFVH